MTQYFGREWHDIHHQQLDKYIVLADAWANRPGAPATGQRFYATDRNLEYEWDGTRWLTTNQYQAVLPFATLAATTTTQFNLTRDYDIYVERLDLMVSQVNAGSGTNYWNWALGTGMGIASGTTNSQAQSAGTLTAYAYTGFTGNPLTLAANTLGRLLITFTLNGTPGNLTAAGVLVYRKIG